MMVFKNRVLFFADTTVNINPSAEELADIAVQTAKIAKSFLGRDPRVAMLSYSNFGSNEHADALKVRKAVELARKQDPALIIDGEMQADTALSAEISKESFPFNRVPGDANVLIFPNLESGNIAYKLISKLGMADAIGPILVGMNKPIFVLQQNSDVNDVVNMAAITAMEIQNRRKLTEANANV
jgi:malate dehydrogenase (oxaloacetate-decarboxylating)(NADP+)